MLEIPVELLFTKNYRVSPIIQNGEWVIPESLSRLYLIISAEILEVQISESNDNELIWEGSPNGDISVKSAYEFCREKEQSVKWLQQLWKKFIPPKLSIFAWKILCNRVTTGSWLCSKGIILSPVCIGCIHGAVEDLNHLLLFCDIVRNIWAWLSELLHCNLSSFSLVVQLIKWAAKHIQNSTVGQIRTASVMQGLWAIWTVRNKLVFEWKTTEQPQSVALLRKAISSVAFLITGKVENNPNEVTLCRFLNAKTKF